MSRGIIARVDPSGQAEVVTAFALVRLMSGRNDPKSAGEQIARVSGVVEVHLVTGQADFLIEVRSLDVEQLGHVIEQVRGVHGVASTETLASVGSFKAGF